MGVAVDVNRYGVENQGTRGRRATGRNKCGLPEGGSLSLIRLECRAVEGGLEYSAGTRRRFRRRWEKGWELWVPMATRAWQSKVPRAVGARKLGAVYPMCSCLYTCCGVAPSALGRPYSKSQRCKFLVGSFQVLLNVFFLTVREKGQEKACHERCPSGWGAEQAAGASACNFWKEVVGGW